MRHGSKGETYQALSGTRPIALPTALALVLCLRQKHRLPFRPGRIAHAPLLMSSLLCHPFCRLARLFWSDDDRFLKQFKAGDLKAKFKSYSKFPPCYKDMAFWVSPEFTENNLCELVRGTFGKGGADGLLLFVSRSWMLSPQEPARLTVCCGVLCGAVYPVPALLQALAATWSRRCS